MSRDVLSKNKEKRSRTSSGESNNSFVKNVTSRVSGYLPATITKWFSSPRSTSNGSAPAAEATDSSTEDEAPESPLTTQPPAKRMRYSSGTDTNCVASTIDTIETTTTYTVQSPPGRTTFRRETNFVSTPIRSPDETTTERSDNERSASTTMFPQHTVSGAGPTVTRKRKSLFGDQSQEISEASKIACVRTSNNTAKDPRQPAFKPALLGSPFYAGRTTYGGAASSYINRPNITQRQHTTVNEATANADNTISHSARRVLELLESYSSPLAEAKRIPQYARPTPQEVMKRISDGAMSSPYKKVNSYKTQELHVPRIASILRLKHRSRLDDTTNAARQLIASHSSSTPDYLTHPYGAPKSDHAQTDTSSKITTKVKSRLTRPARGEAHSLDTEPVAPPDLPAAVLQIDPDNLPNFTLPTPKTSTSSTDKPTANKCETKPTKPVETISKPKTSLSNSIYNFANPVRITSESPKTTSTPPKFAFGSPERRIETVSTKESEPPKPLVPKETEKKAADWQCPDCLVSNKQEAEKCVCCGHKQTSKAPEKAKCSLCKLADSQADSDKCVNCHKVQVNNVAKPLKADTSKWKCKECWVENDEAAGECVCCGADRKGASQNITVKKLDAGGMCSKCYATLTFGKCTKCAESATKPANNLDAFIKSQANKWDCEHCLVKNEITKSKCDCCGADRSGQRKEPEMNKFNFGTVNTTFKFGIDLKVQEASLAKAAEAPVETKEKVEESETNNNVLSKAPTFSFGIPTKKSEDQTDASKENKEKKDEPPKAAFSFGIPKQNSVAPTPAPMFGIPNNVSEAPKTGTEVKDKPQEVKKPEEAPKPQPVIFGATSAPASAPTPSVSIASPFSLGKTDAPRNPLSMPTTSAAAAPTLSFSGAKPEATGLFGSANTVTSISFTPTTAPVTSAGVFQKTDDTSKPLSIFQKSETPASAAAPALLFPASEKPAAPMFSFGSAATAPQNDKPKFNFTFGGNKADNVFKPTFGAPTENNKFTLGNATKENLANSLSSEAGTAASTLPSNNLGGLGAPNALSTGNSLQAGMSATPSLFGAAVQKPMWSAAGGAPNPFNASATSNSLSKPFSFGASTAFNSTAPSFGASTTQPATFGASSTQPATFGAPTTQPATFGASTTQPATFGASTTQPAVFGAPTTQPPAFGASNTQTPAFGASTTQAPAFGAPTTQAPAFGAATTQAPVFGAPTTQAPVFGTTPQPAAFGAPAQPAFGAQSAPNIFGMASQGGQAMFSTAGPSAPVFGAGVFGQPAAAPAFGAPAAAPAPAPSFNFAPQPAQTPVFGFGQQQQPAAAQTGVYSFGGGAPQAVQFNMGAPPAGRRVRKAMRRSSQR